MKKHTPKKTAPPKDYQLPGPKSQMVREPETAYNEAPAEEIVFTARKGVPASLIFSAADDFLMPDKQLAALLHLTVNTIKNYISAKKSLPPVTAEHLLKLIQLFKKGGHIFGSIPEFRGWLAKPSFTLNEAPGNLLNTPGGVDYIFSELERIEFGYPA